MLMHFIVVQSNISSHKRFLRDLKQSCLTKSGISNKPFWKVVQEAGREMSLISEDEAQGLGGTSEVTTEEANKVSIFPSVHSMCVTLTVY